MLKNLSSTTKIFGVLILAVIVITIIAMTISGNKVPQQGRVQFISDNASADNKVEALKTMTANLLAVQDKNKQLAQELQTLKIQNQQTISQFKKELDAQLRSNIDQIKQENQNSQQTIHQALDKFNQSTKNTLNNNYPINGDSDTVSSNMTWVSDISRTGDENNLINELNNHNKSKQEPLSSANSSFGVDSLLHPSELMASNLSNNQKQLAKPVYTIPVNATLTGATLMTPLVGRIPIDGKLPSPYHFKAVLSAKNLTANGYPLPGIKGAVVSGIASGDMLGSCARGDIKSITFVFNDGRISTTKASQDNGSSDDSLGYLSTLSGNPCIAGTFHSNAAIFLGAQMSLAGAQGYGNALAQSQTLNSIADNNESISTVVKNANKYAFGKGFSQAALAAQNWWDQRVRNSFDYVYVPNLNQKTGQSMKVVLNISKQLDINYDPNARKVNYEESYLSNNNNLD